MSLRDRVVRDRGATASGLLFMAASTLCFSAMHGVARYLSDQLHPFEIAFFRNLFGIVVIVPWFLKLGLAPLRTRRLQLHLLRAGLNIFAMLAFFMALSLTPLARVQALAFTAPLFATLIAIFVLGERVGPRRWAALVVGFSGAMLVIRPGFAGLDSGSLLVLASAAIWAVTMIVIKNLARTESSVTITVYMLLFMTPLSLPPALLYWQWPTAEQLVWLAFAALAGTLGQMSMAQAFRLADATAVMPLDFLKLIWGALLGYWFFAEIPDLWTWLGGVLIFAGATYIFYREKTVKAS